MHRYQRITILNHLIIGTFQFRTFTSSRMSHFIYLHLVCKQHVVPIYTLDCTTLVCTFVYLIIPYVGFSTYLGISVFHPDKIPCRISKEYWWSRQCKIRETFRSDLQSRYVDRLRITTL